MKKILITGQRGFIGSYLTVLLQERGYQVVGLSRNPAGEQQYFWDLEKGKLDQTALDGVSAIVHLAGAGIAESRWTARRKKEIVESRVKSAELLYRAVKESGRSLELFVSASGVNYYGSSRLDLVLSEDDPAGEDFLAGCCLAWEDAADRFADMARVVKFRTAMGLAKDGGALEKLLLPLRFGLGSPLGSGNQYLPWIHITDLCNAYLWVLENSTINGVFNLVAPEQITNRQLMRSLARMLKRPFFLPAIPAPLLRLLLGELSSMLVEGNRVSSRKLQESGFNFLFPSLELALNDLF